MREVVATSSVPARGAPVSTPRQNPPQRPAVPADRRPPADQAELSGDRHLFAEAELETI